MDKQELIDKAVNELKGILPPNHVSSPYFVYFDGLCVNTPNSFQSLCKVAEFEKRARELGWINGYQYGVEYPTNGKKPDLPDDCEYVVKYGGKWDLNFRVNSLFETNWPVVESFKVVGERYKPKDQTAQPHDMADNSWHERGELPPAGVKCEVKLNGEWMPVFVVGKNSKGYLVFEPLFDWGFSYDSYGNDALNFRPIKSEREKFIDAASDVMRGTSVVMTVRAQLEICAALFDAGFRAPSDKG